MKKPAPNLKLFRQKMIDWQAALRKHEPDWPPPLFIQGITDLIYSGNIKTAWELVGLVWPSDVDGKEKFLKKYNEALSQSTFYSEFQKSL